MKKSILFLGILIGYNSFIMAQDPTVKIILNEEERFRFDSIRLEFVNSSHHVMIGDSTGMNDTANARNVENTFVGHRAGSIIQSGEYNTPQSGDYNTFLGARAGENHVRGPENLFLGVWAGRYDSAGYFNTYVGPFAGYINKTGSSNTFIGYGAGTYGDSGFANVFIGYNTGPGNNSGSLNAFIGTTSGWSNTSGSQNTFLGTSAGQSNTTGSYNTYIGRRAGRDNQTGYRNLFLGYYAGANEMGSNKLYIANSETDTPLVYGEFDNEILKFHGETRVVDHDVYVTDSSKGIILTSPSGNCFRIKVNDAGKIMTEAVTCP
jgi:hypothetical protein